MLYLLRERPDSEWTIVCLQELPNDVSKHDRLVAEQDAYERMVPLGTLLNKQQPYPQSDEAVRRRERMQRFHETHPAYFRQKTAEQRQRVLTRLSREQRLIAKL